MTAIQNKERTSNIELYRIIVMLLIVAHHYVVNSGLWDILANNVSDSRSIYLYLFGMWGKTGINCFVLITGWFMCTSSITLRKFLKLTLQVYYYNIIISLIFIISGYQKVSTGVLIHMLWPISSVSGDFVSCYLLFFLFVPYLNILIKNLTKVQHLLLLILCLCMYSLFGTIPQFVVRINYVSWFFVLYVLASYIRLYPTALYSKKNFWGWMTLISVVLSIVSVILFSVGNNSFVRILGRELYYEPYRFVADSYKLFSVIVAVCSFLWFKNCKIRQSKFINTVANSTFAVLLIHANSDTMRQWLWRDTLNNIGQYDASLWHLILTSCISVLLVFVLCVLIDQIRVCWLEKVFFKWFDTKFAYNAKCHSI